jgi:hypothetical protein
MRILGTHLVAVSAILLSGLLFLCNPVPLFAQSFPNDTNAHFGKDAACANGHMVNGNLVLANQTFALCSRQSGAILWYGEIRNYNGSAIVCPGSFQPVDPAHPDNPLPNAQMLFACVNTLPNGYYKGYVYWQVTVNGQTMPHIVDYFFRK